MAVEIFQAGQFAGVPVTDAFAVAALQETPVVVSLPSIAWPDDLGPKPSPLGAYGPGEKISGAVAAACDVLIILYTEYELRALLQVFTGNSEWSPSRRAKSWCPYSHNFDAVKPTIQGISQDNALKDGEFGYLTAFRIGDTNVVLFKTELHPKTNGAGLPFIAVIKQLVGELSPKLVISTGTAGAVGNHIGCGDVAITAAARFHLKNDYPAFPSLDAIGQGQTALTSTAQVNATYVDYAAANFTKLSLPGMAQCFSRLSGDAKYAFLKPATTAPIIYTPSSVAALAPQPLAIVSADYLTVDDNNNSEGLQDQGVMNDTDDAFAFYAIAQLPAGQRPPWLSIRNASEPQVEASPFPPGTSPAAIVDALKSTAGAIYGVYQYCTTLNSAFACWGVIAGMT